MPVMVTIMGVPEYQKDSITELAQVAGATIAAAFTLWAEMILACILGACDAYLG
jgi:hypothetical protein